MNGPNDNRYFDTVQLARENIHKYHPGDVVLECLKRLHAPNATEVANMSKQPPWTLLLLMKWAFQYGDFPSYDKKILRESDLNSLINLMHEVGNSVPLPSTANSPLVLLRPLGYQQFWHQQTSQTYWLARQAILFGKLESSHTFRSWFQEDTKTSIEDFIDLSIMVLSQFHKSNVHSLNQNFFCQVAHSFPPNCIAEFLSAISRTPVQLRDYLISLNEERRPNELYERTPLVRYPFLKLGDQYIWYTQNVLKHSLSDFIFDTLRRRDLAAFMDAFGPMFEGYVRLGIESTGISFLDEDKLRQLVGSGSKVVDFLIVEPDVNVFIDAKGVEVGLDGMTSYRPGDVTNAVKSSVIKGISQGLTIARLLRTGSHIPKADFTRSRNFLILVSYKDLFLGTAQEFHESYGKGRLDSILQGDPADTPIPLENVFIISIDEFEYLIACVLSSHSFGEILRPVQKRAADPNTRKLGLIQYLIDTYGDVLIPPFLRTEFENRVSAMARRFGVTLPPGN